MFDGLPERLLEANVTKNPKYDADLKLNPKLCKLLYTASRPDGATAPASLEAAKRRYATAAYGALSAVVMATQKKPEVFHNMLWKPDKKGASPWLSVLDLARTWTFGPFLRPSEARRFAIFPDAKRLRSREARAARSRRSSAQAGVAFAGPTYLAASLALSQSSLGAAEPSQSVTEDLMGESQFLPADDEDSDDVTFSPGKGSASLSQGSSEVEDGGEEEEEEEEASYELRAATGSTDRCGHAKLEASDLNREPAMAFAVRSVLKFHALFGDDALWVAEAARLLARGMPRNVRLFGLKLLLNEDVRPLAAPFMGSCLLVPVLRMAVDELTAPSQGFHTLLQDLCLALNDEKLWLGPPPPEEEEEEGEAAGAASGFFAGNRDGSRDGSRGLAATFVSHLLSVCFVPSPPQMRQNVKDIGALLERWRPRALDLSSVAALLETSRGEGSGGAKGKALASSSAPSSTDGRSGTSGTEAWARRKLGLDLLASLIGAEYPCLSRACPEAPRLARALADSVVFPRKEVYTAAATVVGVALNAIAGAADPCDEAAGLAAAVAARLRSLEASVKELPHLVAVVGRVTALCPGFLTRDLALRLLTHFSQLKSRERAEVVDALNQMTPAELPTDPPLFEHLRHHLPALLTDATEFNVSGVPQRPNWQPSVQLSALAFLALHGPRQDSAHGLRVFLGPSAHSLQSCACLSPSVLVRARAYDILATLFTTNAALRGDAELLQSVRCALLGGLADPDTDGMKGDGDGDDDDDDYGDDDDEGVASAAASGHDDDDDETPTKGAPRKGKGIRRQLFDFWSRTFEYERKSGSSLASSSGLLDQLMGSLWDPAIAHHWTHYASFLLLDSAAASSEYTRKLFRSGLGSGAFTPLRLSRGLALHRPMEPALSLGSQMALFSQTQGMHGRSLPETLTDDVSQIAPGLLKATQQYNWTQTQHGGGGTGTGTGSQALLASQAGSFRASDFGSVFDAPTQMSQGVVFGVQLQGAFNVGVGKGAMPPPPARRRRQAGSGFSADLDQLRRRTVSAEQSKAARKRRVAIYRSYRDGERPPVMPLQARRELDPSPADLCRFAPQANCPTSRPYRRATCCGRCRRCASWTRRSPRLSPAPSSRSSTNAPTAPRLKR